MKRAQNNIIRTGIAMAIALAAWLPTNLNAAEEMKPMKGGEHLLMLNKIETKAQADALKPDDSIAMVCAKCKTVWVSRVKQGVKGAQVLMAMGQPKELIGTHACGGCNSTLEVTGHGKGKDTVLKHSCKTCGDESAFCCATKSGSAATKETEKK
jgi:ribosomal protein L44E